MSSRAQYATLDSSINAVVNSGLTNPNEALSDALYVVQRNQLQPDAGRGLSLGGHHARSARPTTRSDCNPTLADVKNSLNSVTQPRETCRAT